MKALPYMNILHYIALASAFLGVAFVCNNFLTFIFDLPGVSGTLALLGANLFEPVQSQYSSRDYAFGLLQVCSYLGAILIPHHFRQLHRFQEYLYI